MNNKFEQLINKAKGINLSSGENSAIKQSVLNFVSKNPVSQNALARPSLWSSMMLTKFNFVSAMAILLLITMVAGGGIAIGAERALPGDALYSVKIGVNEEVRGWLFASEEAKANWEVERVQRRLEEAEEMAADGSLSVEARENIEANFQAHADRVKSRIEKFENKENFQAAVDVSSRFEASLRAHQKILGRLSAESKEEIKKEVRPIEVRVKSMTDSSIKARKMIELRAGGSIDTNLENDDDDKNESDVESEINLNLESGTIKVENKLRTRLGL